MGDISRGARQFIVITDETDDVNTIKRFVNWNNGCEDQEMTDVVYKYDIHD